MENNKKGLGSIKLDPNKKGTFIKYCKSKGHDSVSCECIKEGLGSPNAKTRKRANFAKNFGNPQCK